jgi:hypothetical protein
MSDREEEGPIGTEWEERLMICCADREETRTLDECFLSLPTLRALSRLK